MHCRSKIVTSIIDPKNQHSIDCWNNKMLLFVSCGYVGIGIITEKIYKCCSQGFFFLKWMNFWFRAFDNKIHKVCWTLNNGETVFKIPTKQWTQNLDHKFKIYYSDACMTFSVWYVYIQKVSYHQVIYIYFCISLSS